jgi:tRNA 2-thiouridine synthesizing protein A
MPDPAATTAPARRLDVIGLLCPVPVLRTARAVATMPAGALLEVVGSDPLMRLDLAAWCAREGHEVVAMEAAGEVIRCLLRVGTAGATDDRDR